MKKLKIISLLLSALFLFPHELFLEPLKFPSLVQHYFACKEKEQNMGFVPFILIHYTDNEHHTKDHEEHNELPFCHHHSAECIQSIVQFQPVAYTHFKMEIFSFREVLFKNYSQHFFSQFHPSIWQPPNI